MKKRLLSLALAFVLAFSLLPATAFAATKTLSEYFNGMPISANGGTGTTAWKVSGDMLMSGNAGKSYSTSTLTLTFNADTAISFEYKVSSEANYDKCTITLGSTTIANAISGDGDWKDYTGTAKKGDQLVVTYKKDSSGDDNDDCVYLRNFTCGTPVVVTLHANNDTDETATQNIYGGKGTLKANTFTNPGKVFAGWATEVGGAVVYPDGAEITAEDNTDLYAVWGDAYTVTFVNDGQTTGTADVAQNTAIGTVKMPKDPTKKGYTFEGWFNGETKLTADTVISGDVTYTAKWTAIRYTIVLNPGAGVGEKVTLDAVYDQDVTLPKNTFTRDGYDFNGWGTSASASYGSIEDGAAVKNLTDKDGAAYDLYATWKGKAVKVTLDFNYEGAEPIERTGSVGSNFNYDNGKFLSIETQKRPGYLFDGWFDAAEGGNEITNQDKFTAEDAEKGVTLYAHWSEAVTITFDANGGTFYYAEKKDIRKGTAYGSLPEASLSGKAFDGWYTEKDGGIKVANDTVFNEDTTLYARYRSYQITVSFNANSGTGEMDKLVCESKVAKKLPKCTFTREGYDFTGWSISSYSSTVSYADEADYTYPYTAYRDTTTTLYAVWKANISKTAIDAIDAVIPKDHIIRTETTLPTAGDGYTIAYTGDSARISSDGRITLPASGTAEITVTATITDTATNKTYTKEYALTLYSADVAATEAELNNAAAALGTKNFVPVYGTDTNAITAVEKKLLDAGCEGIAVSIKEAVTDSGNYSGIDQDGTIHYYFNPGMTKYGSYFYTTFVLSKNGASVEKKWYTSIDWDKAKVREALNTVADTLSVPETATADMTLPQIANEKNWSNVTWSSSDPKVLTIGSAPSYPYYSPYPVTLNAAEDTTVVLTATVKCNSVDGVAVTREFECTVPGGTSTGVDYQAKLDNALSDVGLKDFVTGEKLTADANGVYATVNDIQFPTTRNLKIDGKYTPVVITSSDPDVIENPDVANASRVNIYRPLPGQAAKDVTVTIQILDRSSGTGKDYANMPVLASRDVKISVQPLTQAEINAEIELMQQAKAHYWDGIRNANTDQNNVTTDLHAFQECYLNDSGALTWVYNYTDRQNHGIIPDELDNWYDQQIWRLFRSSNADVVAHENLLVTRQEESKAVTVTSYLSSETLGKYAAKYPQNADFQKLYKQPVTINLVVTGTKYAQGGDSTERENAAKDALSNRAMLTVDFTLTGSGMGFSETNLKYAEGSTAFDVFSDMLAKHGYTCKRKGSYIAAITSDTGKTLEEFDEGKNSGWMYRVNGKLSDKYMAQQGLQDGDSIEVFFTADYTKEPGSGSWNTVNAADQKAANAVDQLISAIGAVTDKSGSAIEKARAAYDKLTAAQKKLVRKYDTLTAAEKRYAALTGQKPAFDDVPEIHWAYDAVCYVALQEMMIGNSQGQFQPDSAMNRAMTWTVLSRVAGKSLSTSADPWYGAARAWAQETQLSDGTAPLNEVTREQMVVMLCRYAEQAGLSVEHTGDLSAYSDGAAVSDWAKDAMSWAVGCGLIQGANGKLMPQKALSRAEAAALYQRFAQQSVKA